MATLRLPWHSQLYRRDETKQISEFDYVVVNRDGQLDECVAQICSIISAEKLRTWR